MKDKVDLDTIAEAYEILRKELIEDLDRFGKAILKVVRSPTSREGEEEATELDIDVNKVAWQRSKRAGGGAATSGDPWVWAFARRRDGSVPPENVDVLQALDLYGGPIIAQGYEISYGSDPKFLNRKKVKR